MKKTILLAILLAIFPLISFASIDTNLKYGMKNTEVSELQDFLVDKSYMNASTGFFGLLTLKAVQNYQAANSIPSTGYVGILTRTAINAELDKDISGSLQAEIDETGTTTPAVCAQGDLFNMNTGARCDGTNVSNQIQQLQNQVDTLTQTVQGNIVNNPTVTSQTGGNTAPSNINQPIYTVSGPIVACSANGISTVTFTGSNSIPYIYINSSSTDYYASGQPDLHDATARGIYANPAVLYIGSTDGLDHGIFNYYVQGQSTNGQRGNALSTSTGSFTINTCN